MNSVRSKFLLLPLLFWTLAEAGAQQLVCGGFASFALPDSNAGHNAGGFALAGDGLSNCLQVQLGLVFGQAGLYDVGGAFNDQCREPVRYTETDISVFPNPGTGLYTLRGSGISACLVYDAGGRLVHRADYTAPEAYEQKLQIQFLSEGMYRLRLLGTDGPVYQTSIIKINP